MNRHRRQEIGTGIVAVIIFIVLNILAFLVSLGVIAAMVWVVVQVLKMTNVL